MCFAIAVLASVIAIVSASIKSFADNVGKYEEEAETFWNSTIDWIHSLGGDYEDDSVIKAKLASVVEKLIPEIAAIVLTMAQVSTFISSNRPHFNFNWTRRLSLIRHLCSW